MLITQTAHVKKVSPIADPADDGTRKHPELVRQIQQSCISLSSFRYRTKAKCEAVKKIHWQRAGTDLAFARNHVDRYPSNQLGRQQRQ